MGDTIHRQVAIDALKAMAVPLYKDPECNDIWERDRILDSAIDVMRGLPSAEPEIIRCKYCVNAEERGCALFCGFWSRYTSHKGYCFKAERRTDNESSKR